MGVIPDITKLPDDQKKLLNDVLDRLYPNASNKQLSDLLMTRVVDAQAKSLPGYPKDPIQVKVEDIEKQLEELRAQKAAAGGKNHRGDKTKTKNGEKDPKALAEVKARIEALQKQKQELIEVNEKFGGVEPISDGLKTSIQKTLGKKDKAADDDLRIYADRLDNKLLGAVATRIIDEPNKVNRESIRQLELEASALSAVVRLNDGTAANNIKDEGTALEFLRSVTLARMIYVNPETVVAEPMLSPDQYYSGADTSKGGPAAVKALLESDKTKTLERDAEARVTTKEGKEYLQKLKAARQPSAIAMGMDANDFGQRIAEGDLGEAANILARIGAPEQATNETNKKAPFNIAAALAAANKSKGGLDVA